MKMILPYWRNTGFSWGSDPIAFLRCDFSGTQMAGTLSNYQDWASSTNYTVGQKVAYAYDIWEKVTTAPAGTIPGATADWKKIGTTNIRAPFDLSTQLKGWVYSGFSSATPKIVSINPYYGMSGYYLSVAVVDSVLIVGMIDVQSVTISYKRYSSLDAQRTEIATVWTETLTVAAGCIFKQFGESIPKPAANEYSGVEIKFNPAGVNTVMQIGDIILGRVFECGETRPGYSVVIDDYSKKTVDAYGAVTVVERPYSKSMVIDSMIDADADADGILNSIVNYRAKMNGFVGVVGRPSTYTIGMPSGISLKYDGPRKNIISMKIDGVI